MQIVSFENILIFFKKSVDIWLTLPYNRLCCEGQPNNTNKNVRLAQLDRAFGYGPKGRGFESSNARLTVRIWFWRFLFYHFKKAVPRIIYRIPCQKVNKSFDFSTILLIFFTPFFILECVGDGVFCIKLRNCSVPSQLRPKMHKKSPSVMAFWLVCLGILTYSCQNTSWDSGYWIVTKLL